MTIAESLHCKPLLNINDESVIKESTESREDLAGLY